MKYFNLLLAISFFGLSAPAYGTHIVGGEFELVHLNDDIYKLNLIIYYDEINGAPGTKDPYLYPYVYRKSDDARMDVFTLRLTQETDVPYTNPICTYEGLETSRLLYTTNIRLPAARYSDPEGYYIVWERCCRNSTITNVVPPIDDTIGQTFYLEFPPVEKDGLPFHNSSPVLFPPLSDYACLNVDYYVDFGGTDPDGDSLVYSLATPLNSSEPTPVPIPKPRGTQQGIPWIAGIDSSNMVPGNPALQINKDGLLRVTPGSLGLFVFAALCEEYREGVKIGEVRRDFQLLVIDCPPQGNPPSIAYKRYEEEVYLTEYQAIDFANTLAGDERCMEFIISDKDVTGIANLRIQPINFKNTPVPVYQIEEESYNAAGDTLFLKVCFTECPALEGEHIINFIGNDNSCPLPKMDTVQLGFTIEPIENVAAVIQTADDFVRQKLFVDSTFSVEIEGLDADGDFLELSLLPIDFATWYFDMSLVSETDEAGYIKGRFNWKLNCSQFSENDTLYVLKFLLDDLDNCDKNPPDTLTYEFELESVENQAPYFVDVKEHIDLVVYGNEVLEFEIQARDNNLDPIWLTLQTENFYRYNYDISFSDSYAEDGYSDQIFKWDLRCEQFNLEYDSIFNFSFIVNDYPECQYGKYETMTYSVLVRAPRNEAPFFEDQENTVNKKIFMGDHYKLELKGRDSDQDFLQMSLLEANFNLEDYNISYNEISNAAGAVDATFSWNLSCEQISREPGKVFEIKFLVSDANACIADEADTLKLYIALEDVKGDFTVFNMPNVITPNGDSKNDFFEMCHDDDPNCNLVYQLPYDDCENKFLGIEIFNRWGRRVYLNNSRNFKWDGSESPGGTYFYILSFTQRQYKGTLSIIYD